MMGKCCHLPHSNPRFCIALRAQPLAAIVHPIRTAITSIAKIET
jgi:hypothetical protein